MKSMTGFGAASFSAKGLGVDVSVKSVNGRYCEIRFHMPKLYLPIESQLKKVISAVVGRGTVDVFINRRSLQGAESGQVVVRQKVAEDWARQLRRTQKKLKLQGDLDINHLMRLPDVAAVNEIKDVSEKERLLLLRTLKKACVLIDRERLREGRALKKDLLLHLKKLKSLCVKMKGKRELANKGLHKKYKQRIDKLKVDGVEPARLAQEVAIQIDRSDISEEITRLNEHLNMCQSLISSGQVSGKKLDFYCQELLREVNTIGSKSQLADLTRLVVESKTTIEKFREQVQNIE